LRALSLSSGLGEPIMSDEAGHEVTLLLRAVGCGDEIARERLMEAVYHELREIAAKQMAREAGPRTLQPTALVHEAYLRLFGASTSPLLSQEEWVENPLPDGRGSDQAEAPPLLSQEEWVENPLPDGRGSDHAEAPPLPCGRGSVQTNPHFENRRLFFTAAAEAMRRILVEGARRRGRKKRGGGRPVLPQPDDPPDPNAEAEYDTDELLDVDAAFDTLARAHPREAEVVKLRYFAGLTVEAAAVALGIAPRTVEKDFAFARAWLKRALAVGDDEL
jgi:RNA polymerase sigma factor (sigma-70 family)